MNVKSDGIEFTRQELYDMLRSNAISQIADKYHIDNEFLSKQIYLNGIPCRTVKDWDRIYAGEVVARPPLSGDAAKILFFPFIDGETSCQDSSIEEVAVSLEEDDNIPSESLIVDSSLKGVTVTRRELYRLLATVPKSQIVQKLGIQYGAFNQILEDNNIPSRDAQDWDAVRRGWRVKMDPLIGDPDIEVFLPCTHPDVLSRKQSGDLSLFGKAGKTTVKVNPVNSNAERYEQSRLYVDTYDRSIPLYKLFGLELEDIDGEKFSHTYLWQMGLSVRSINALVKQGITNLGAILKLTLQDLIGIKNLGVLSVNEIVSVSQELCSMVASEDENVSVKPDKIEDLMSELALAVNCDSSLFGQVVLAFCKMNKVGQAVAAETMNGLATRNLFQNAKD